MDFFKNQPLSSINIRPTNLFTAAAPLLIIVHFMLSLTSGAHPLPNSVARPAPAVFNSKSYSGCEVCDPTKCPALHYCEGKAVKDHCRCCMICSDDSFQPHISQSTPPKGVSEEACKEVRCPNLKFCIQNVQGLPLCECPGEHMCKSKRYRKREICGIDGKTYSSRCHMRIASCNHGVHIRKAYRGKCKAIDIPVNAAAYRRKLRKLKRRRMKKRRMRKQGKNSKEREEKRARRKEKREKRRRKRRKSGGKKKKRSRRHRKVDENKLAAWENNFGLATWN